MTAHNTNLMVARADEKVCPTMSAVRVVQFPCFGHTFCMEDASESFYAGAIDRIRLMMAVLGVALSLAAWPIFGWRVALGFACGCAVAYLNFHWLKRVINALADRITSTGKRQAGRGIVLRFLLRYVLMGVAAYVIFSVSPASLYGLLAGLSLPVAAIACEAAYELYVAVARGL